MNERTWLTNCFEKDIAIVMHDLRIRDSRQVVRGEPRAHGQLTVAKGQALGLIGLYLETVPEGGQAA